MLPKVSGHGHLEYLSLVGRCASAAAAAVLNEQKRHTTSDVGEFHKRQLFTGICLLAELGYLLSNPMAVLREFKCFPAKDRECEIEAVAGTAVVAFY